jgi:hypothetical protein
LGTNYHPITFNEPQRKSGNGAKPLFRPPQTVQNLKNRPPRPPEKKFKNFSLREIFENCFLGKKILELSEAKRRNF